MAETFQSLLKSFRDVTTAKLKDNKDSAPVKLLVRTVKSLETVLASLDKFLKSKNIDVGKAYESTKNKGKSVAEAGKRLLEEAKEKGLKTTLTGKALDIKSKLTNIFSGDKEKQAGPPEEGKSEVDGETEAEPKESKVGKAKTAIKNIKEKIQNKLNGGGGAPPLEEKKSWLDRVKERTSKRKEEVEEEKKAVQTNVKKGKGGGWLGKVLSGVMSLGGMIVGGLTKSINFLGGFLLKGFSKALFRLIPGLSGGIAKATQAIVVKGLSLAGRGVMGAAGMAARAILPMAGSALGMVARGAAMLATGPVGWVVAAGTAIYAGYKLYKYLTRNDVSSDVYGKLTRLRLLMYGVNDVNKEYYSKIFDLEMLMKDYVKFSNYQVQITKLDSKAIEKVLDLFSISRDEKEKYAVLNTWFMKRFIPAYKAFVQALYTVNNNIYLDELDKLKPGDLVSFISKFQIPGIIYNVTQAPTGDQTNILVKKEDVDALYINICNDIKAKAPKEKTLEEKAREQNVQAAEKQKQAAAAAQKQPTTVEKKPVKKEEPVPTGKEQSGPDTEGESKPNVKDDLSKTQAKAAGKLNKASGELAPGGMSLEGIATKLDKSKIYNLDPNVRELFTGMAKEYNTLTGKNIPVNEAFRSYEDQANLYKKMPDRAAKPGNSTHEYGLAVDINSDTSKELDKMGLLRKYGFTTSVGGEKWHLEPIGVSINPTMAKNDENFRNKAILASPGKGGGGYGFLEDSVMKKRDTNYQLSIYNSNGENPIDVEKVAAATAANKASSPTGAVIDSAPKKDDSAKISTASKIAQTPTDTAKTSTPVIGQQAKPIIASKDSEGENKPSSIPTTKTPFVKKDETPSLNGKSPSPNTNSNMDIGKYADLPPETAIKQAAKMTGNNEDTMMTFAKIESGMDPNAKSKSSSASGLFGLTDPTWEEQLDKNGDKYNVPPNANKNNPFYNALMAGEYSKNSIQRISGWQTAGMDEPSAMYLGHHFGVSGANKMLSKANQDPNVPVKDAVSEAAYKANSKELGNQTVGDYLNTIGQKIASVAGKVFKPKERKSPDTSTGNDTKISGGDNIAASKPPVEQAKMTKTSSESYMVRPAKLSITSSGYGSSMMNNNGTAKDSVVQDSFKQMFDTSKMEGIMSQQLDELKNIVGVLRSIDGKFVNPNGGTSQPQPQKTTPPPVDKTIPNSSINLTRKSLSA